MPPERSTWHCVEQEQCKYIGPPSGTSLLFTCPCVDAVSPMKLRFQGFIAAFKLHVFRDLCLRVQAVSSKSPSAPPTLTPMGHTERIGLLRSDRLREFILFCILQTSKKWWLQTEGRQSRRQGVEMKSDWLFDKPQSNCWLRVAASNLASQSPFLAGVTHSHCNPQ